MRSVYQVLGGEAALNAIAEGLYQRVVEDPQLALFFDGVDIQRQRQKFRAFLGTVLGGPYGRSGIELSAAHADAVERGLNRGHVAAFQTHLRAALEAAAISPALVEEVLARMQAAGPEVLGEADA